MKKTIILLALFMMIAAAAMAQNSHWSYGINNSNTISVSSAVTVITSTGKAYLAQTQSSTNTIWLSIIDPTTMQAYMFSDSYNYASSKQYIILRGGFEDLNGKIVLYGYCYDSVGYNYGYVAEFDPTSLVMTCREPSVTGEIIKGCSGLSPTGSVVNMFVFNEGEIYALDVLSTTPPPVFYGMQYNGQMEYFSDVQWDSYHNCFVASGSHPNPYGVLCPFIVCYQFDVLTHTFSFWCQYDVDDNTYTNWSEGRALFSIIDDDHLVLYQDMREDSNDIIWLTLLKGYYSSPPVILKSTYFIVPLHKLSTYGMVYNKFNNSLNLLGLFDYCIPTTTFLAQTDPYSLSYLNIGQITSPTVNVTCYTWNMQQINGNSIQLNNITLNPFNPCSTVISTGVARSSIGFTAYLTETYDISLSSCDILLPVWDNLAFPTSNTISTPIQHNTTYSAFLVNSPSSNHTLTNKECYDYISCYKDMNGTIDDSTKSVSAQESMAIIHVEEGHFVCHGFIGIIHYEIFTSTGKLICKGKTSNDKSTPICTDNPGLYIIRCMDNQKFVATTKVIVSR
ncbi:MAG: T9SS type A sorting domain-containing protein [Bacteroidales bacterium]|nr:T9SS type A sorting domain-containing protein [Bacteroidales bacterium]